MLVVEMETSLTPESSQTGFSCRCDPQHGLLLGLSDVGTLARRLQRGLRWLAVSRYAVGSVASVARAKRRTTNPASGCSADHLCPVGTTTHDDGASSSDKYRHVATSHSNARSDATRRSKKPEQPTFHGVIETIRVRCSDDNHHKRSARERTCMPRQLRHHSLCGPRTLSLAHWPC